MNDRSQIEIVLAANESYFLGLLVTAASIVRYADADSSLSFSILDGGISEKSRNELCRILGTLLPSVRVRFLTIDLAAFSGLPKLSGSAMTYARILLPDVLPEADFAIYCDVDFLWNADIAELWNLRDSSCALMSVPETCDDTLARERQWAASRGVPFPSAGYFCAGMCLLNLRMFRERNLGRQVVGFLERHPDVIFHDQSALNFSFSENCTPVKMLPRKWQVFTHEVLPSDIEGGCALHFAGNTPWLKVTMLTDAEMLWYREWAAARGQTLWRALCTVHSPLAILFGRLLFKVLTVNGFAASLLRRMGRPHAANLLRPLPREKITTQPTGRT